MPDFESVIRERMQGTNMDAEVCEEVIREIAEHLEHCFEAAMTSGMREEDAEAQAMRQVRDWKKFGRAVRSAREDSMKERMRKIWAPGLSVCFLCITAINVIIRYKHPVILEVQDFFLALSWQWCAVYVLGGALSAWWCRKVGGTVKERIVVTMFTPMFYGILLASGIVVAMFVDRQVPNGMKTKSMALMVVWMILVPAISLMIGAAPFMRGGAPEADKKETPRSMATSA